MASASPTTKNEYTGLFKDYNVILITAESFSPWAVDEKLTPTLYKMVHTGFVMNNFYIPAFNNTSDGEYMVCTGLIPNGQGNHSFQDTADNDMALCFGNILGPLGYSTNAYHPIHIHSTNGIRHIRIWDILTKVMATALMSLTNGRSPILK